MRGAAEAHDQASGRTGNDPTTRLWLGETRIALGRMCNDVFGVDVTHDPVADTKQMVLTPETYQPAREVVQTLTVLGKLTARRLVRVLPAGITNRETQAMLGYLRSAGALLTTLELYADQRDGRQPGTGIDQYRINLLAPLGLAEGCFGNRNFLSENASLARQTWRLSETDKVINPDPNMPDADRKRAQQIAHWRAWALTIADYSPHAVRLRIGRVVL